MKQLCSLLTPQLKSCSFKTYPMSGSSLCYFPTESTSEASKRCIQVLKCESDLPTFLQIVSCQIQLFSHINRASQARWEEKCCPNTMGKNCIYYSSLVLPAPPCSSAWKSWQCMLHSWFILYENTLPQASVIAHAFTVKHDLKVE